MIGFRRLHGTVSPVRHRLGLHFQIHDQNINFERVIEFITLLHRHLRGKFILVLDRYSAHRKAVRLLQEEHPDWFEVEWLPAYAPDLVEMVWNHSKYSDLPTLSLRMWMISIRRSPPHWGRCVRRRRCCTHSSNMPDWSCDCSFYSTKFNRLSFTTILFSIPLMSSPVFLDNKDRE